MKLSTRLVLTTWLASTAASLPPAEPVYSRCSTIQGTCWGTCKKMPGDSGQPIDSTWEDGNFWCWLADFDNGRLKCEVDEDCPTDEAGVYCYQSDGVPGGCGV